MLLEVQQSGIKTGIKSGIKSGNKFSGIILSLEDLYPYTNFQAEQNSASPALLLHNAGEGSHKFWRLPALEVTGSGTESH